jgi:hypothetical protein
VCKDGNVLVTLGISWRGQLRARSSKPRDQRPGRGGEGSAPDDD